MLQCASFHLYNKSNPLLSVYYVGKLCSHIISFPRKKDHINQSTPMVFIRHIEKECKVNIADVLYTNEPSLRKSHSTHTDN